MTLNQNNGYKKNNQSVYVAVCGLSPPPHILYGIYGDTYTIKSVKKKKINQKGKTYE